jgi:hypothetical protein
VKTHDFGLAGVDGEAVVIAESGEEGEEGLQTCFGRGEENRVVRVKQ